MVARDRRTLTLLLSARRGRELLAALAAGSPIAAVFSRPSTHATLQLNARCRRAARHFGATRIACSALPKPQSAVELEKTRRGRFRLQLVQPLALDAR